MNVNEQYTSELRTRFGYSATWLPNTHVELGDVGILRNYEYERVRTLRDFSVYFETRSDAATGMLDYTSADSVSVVVKAAGAAPAGLGAATNLKGNLEVSFNREHAVFFQASGCTTTSIADQHQLAQSLLDLYQALEWPEEYVVVTEVVNADRATVLVSSGSDALIEFAVDSGVALGQYALVDASAHVNIARSTNIGTQIVAQGGLTPLFKAKGIRKRLLRSPIFDRRSLDSSVQPSNSSDETGGNLFLGDVDYAHFRIS